jgi:hypothetical protein
LEDQSLSATYRMACSFGAQTIIFPLFYKTWVNELITLYQVIEII